MIVALASFTARGGGLAETLVNSLSELGHHASHTPIAGGGLAVWTEKQFSSNDALIFVGAAGIAVRAVAPHLRSKLTDPAVVSVDEWGRYAVPLVSGHIGGANNLARQLAALCGGVAVISTATDLNGVFAVDNWATAQGLRIVNPERIKRVSAKLLAGESAVFSSDQPIAGALPPGIVHGTANTQPDVVVTCRVGDYGQALVLAPAVLTVGIGCRRGKEETAICAQFQQVLWEHRLLPQAVRAVATIDRKADEPGLLAFCERLSLPLLVYTAEELKGVQGVFTPSSFVRDVTGVDNVCERAAMLACGGDDSAERVLLVRKQSRDGVTVAVGERTIAITFNGCGKELCGDPGEEL